MKELIKIQESNGNRVVSARELHEFLEVKADFSTWAKRMFEYGFEEGLDYSLLKIGERKAHNKIDYALTLDCAKEISMLQRNEKGKQARRYFIAVEKKAKKPLDLSDPQTVLQLAKNWAEEQKKREEAEKQVKRLQPKAELMDKVLSANEKINIGECAKILELPFGRNTMFKKLREKGIFFKNKNEPKQQYVNQGYFVLKEKFVERNNHPGFVIMVTLVTQKGLAFLCRVFDSQPRDTDLAKLG